MRALWGALGLDGDTADAGCLAAPVADATGRTGDGRRLSEALVSLQQAGVSIRFINIARNARHARGRANVVMCYEGARFHQQRYEEHGSNAGRPG